MSEENKRTRRANKEIYGELDLAALDMAAAFETYLRLTEAQKRRWDHLAKYALEGDRQKQDAIETARKGL